MVPVETLAAVAVAFFIMGFGIGRWYEASTYWWKN